MTNEEILQYLARCNCSPCMNGRRREEKSLKELYLDSVFNSVKEKLARDMMDELKQRQKALVTDFVQFFERSVTKKAEEILCQAFDASCSYGFKKRDVENESH